VAYRFLDGTGIVPNTDPTNRSTDRNRSVPLPMIPIIRLAGTPA
jgi:hypothetical protein